MHLHLLGLCGTFMGGLALLARELGHDVTGSDENVYPPMSTQLEQAGISLLQGYRAEHLRPQPDLVVIGNALSRGNPAVEYVLDQEIPYCSGPQWLADAVLRGRTVLAIAGTHGKTTTSSLVARILDYAGLAPGFLIGGVPLDFGCSARLGTGACFVVEADEYDTAFFDKRAKFIHYRPRVLVMNNLEFDHADIFADLGAIELQFHHLVRTVPARGRIIVPHADATIARVLARGCWTPISTFGGDAEADFRVHSLAPDHSRFEVHGADLSVGIVTWQSMGAHNAANALAALAASAAVGVRLATGCAALADHRGVARRLQLLDAVDGVAIYDDFAHHPTAIARTIEALRARVGAARIIAVLEPRSNSMRMGVFGSALGAALAAADSAVLLEPAGLGWDLSAATAELGARRVVLPSVDAMLGHLSATLRPGDHVLAMSNGGFGGLHRRLAEALRARGTGAA